MQPYDGNHASIYNAVKWTVDELSLYEEHYTLEAYFEEGGTFELFQDPIIGWMTTNSDKLGFRAQKLTFKYVEDHVTLVSFGDADSMSLTALKAAVLATKLFSRCMHPFYYIPNAQPLSPEEWNFPMIGAGIDLEKLRTYKIAPLFYEINPLDSASSRAIGRIYEGERMDVSNNTFAEGDIVVIRRTRTRPTFGRVLAVMDKVLQVSVTVDSKGKALSRKNVNTNSILCHWGANEVKLPHENRKRKL